MLSLKKGSKIKGLKAEILLGLLIVERVLESHGFECVITEGTGGKHMEGSLHYQGLAVDIRSKHLGGLKDEILIESKDALGSNFDMILESKGQPAEHYHLEFDPK